MQIEGVPHAGVQRGNHVGLAVDLDADVTDDRLVENRVNRRAIVLATLWEALDAGARSGHDVTLSKQECGDNSAHGKTLAGRHGHVAIGAGERT